MKKPIAIHFNDLHIKSGNEHLIWESIVHMVEYANSIGVTNLICGGDVFDSRSFQRLSCLKVWEKALDLFHLNNIICHTNVGNHDKTSYTEIDSFLDVYKYHPSMSLCRSCEIVDIEGVSFTIMPFFDDKKLVPMLKDAEGTDVLIGHFEMQGSTNLGNVSDKANITRRMLKKWKKTYLSHYHNTHEITKDIIHLPSLRQSNFGEDPNKGFTVLYDDLSYEIIRGCFKEFKKLVIDLDTITMNEVKDLIKTHKDSEDIVRFEFTGEESKLKALDKGQFAKTGIDVKIKHVSKFDESKLELPKVVKKYDKEQVSLTFKEFCKEKGYDHAIGMKYLNEFLGIDQKWYYYSHPESDEVWKSLTELDWVKCFAIQVVEIDRETFLNVVEELGLKEENCIQ